MTESEKRALAASAGSLKRAKGAIHRTLAKPKVRALLTQQRIAELEACAVILSRAENDLWKQYPLKDKP